MRRSIEDPLPLNDNFTACIITATQYNLYLKEALRSETVTDVLTFVSKILQIIKVSVLHFWLLCKFENVKTKLQHQRPLTWKVIVLNYERLRDN